MAAKKTTRKAAQGRTAAKKDTTPVNARRVGAERLAETAWARGPDFWAEMVAHGMRIKEVSARAATSEPRQAAH